MFFTKFPLNPRLVLSEEASLPILHGLPMCAIQSNTYQGNVDRKNRGLRSPSLIASFHKYILTKIQSCAPTPTWLMTGTETEPLELGRP